MPATEQKELYTDELKSTDKALLEQDKKVFPHNLKDWAHANVARALEVKTFIHLMAYHYGVSLTSILLLQRAVQCHWNIFHNAPKKGITTLGVITKSYVNLFKADAPEASAIVPLKPQYSARLTKPIYSIRERLVKANVVVPDHHVYLALFKAAILNPTMATGDERRSAGADSEFGNVK